MTVPVAYLGPEKAFRIGEISTDGTRLASSMPTGPWLTDRFGAPLAGSLGVLVDDILGYSIAGIRPDDRWSVSSEVSLDILRPLVPDTTGPWHAAAVGAVHVDDLSGHASGTVTDADGELLAVCAQRGRWVPFHGRFGADTGAIPDLSAATCVEELLGGTPQRVEGGATLHLTVGPVLANPLGTLHGGLTLCASDLVASAAVATWDAPWALESIRVQYLRPVPRDSDIEFRAVVRHAGRTRAVVDVTGSIGGRLCTLAHLTGRPGAR